MNWICSIEVSLDSCCAKDRKVRLKQPTCFWLIPRRSCLALTTWPEQHVRRCASFSPSGDALPGDGVDGSQSWRPNSWGNFQHMLRLGPMSHQGCLCEFHLSLTLESCAQQKLSGICRNRCCPRWAESYAHHQAEPTSEHPCATSRWSTRSWQVGTHVLNSSATIPVQLHTSWTSCCCQADAEMELHSISETMLAPVYLEQPVCHCPDLPFTCEYPYLQEIRILESIFMRVLEKNVNTPWFSISRQHDMQVKQQATLNWRTRNLCFAKHRHSSVLKPASRFVLHLSAILYTAMEIRVNDCQWLLCSKSWVSMSMTLSGRVNNTWFWWMIRIYERRSLPKPKKRAADFLYAINAESILQIAMMCDAAAEEMELILESNCIAVSVSALLSCLMATLRIRFNDRNTVDVAQLRAAMDSFLARVTALFVNRKACNIHCYTHAASWLFHREGNIHNAQSECECRQFRHLFIY